MSQQGPSGTPASQAQQLRPRKPAAGPAVLACLTTALAGLAFFVDASLR